MPVDQSTRDRAPAKAGPPAPRITLPPLAPPPKPRVPYKPAVAAHDLPTTRDTRQSQRAPYANLFGPGRSAAPPDAQIAIHKAAGTALLPKAQSALTKHLASIPHPVERLAASRQVAEAGILPTAAIPLVADTAHQALKNVASGVDPGRATNILAGFPQLDVPNEGAVRKELEAAAKARGRTLPANATLTDLYEAKYGKGPAGWKGVYENLPRDAVLTPVYAAEGTYGILHAIGQAERGNTSGLKEIAAQQADVVRHPKEFIQNHPFQTILAVAGPAKFLGRAGAVAKNLTDTPLVATPRTVPLLDETGVPLPPVNGEVPAFQRGTLSTRNLTTRGAQKFSDYLLAHSKTRQKSALAGVLRDARAQSRADVAKDAGATLKPFLQARGKISKAEAQRVLENEARGITPDAHSVFRGNEPVATPDLSPQQHDFLTAAQGVEQANVERLKRMGLLTDAAAQRRAYHPALQVANSLGHPTAEHFVDLEREIDHLHDQLGKVDDSRARKLQTQITQLRSAKHADLERQIGELDKRITRLSRVQKAPPGRKPRRMAAPAELRHLAAKRKALVDQQGAITSAPIRALEQRLDETPTKGMVEGQIEQTIAERSAALDQFAQEHAAAGGSTPLRVPEQPVKRVTSKYGQAGGGSGIAAAKRRLKPYTGALFEHGTYKPITDEAFLRDAAVPSRVEEAYRFAAEVSDPKRGIVQRAPAGADIPDGYVLQEIKNQANPLRDELAATTGTAPAKRPLESLLSTFDTEATRVPANGKEYRLWPATAYQHLQGMQGLNPATGGARVAQQAGRVLRNALLYSRPAYPITNAVSNMAQSALLANVIPLIDPAYAQALNRDAFPVPSRIEGTGTAAVNFDALGSGSLRTTWADRNSTAGGVARVALHPIARYTQGLYRSSVAIEDWTRRATYLRHAVPAARRIAHPDLGPVQRFAASFKPADAAVKEVLQHMADGKTPEARAAATAAVTKVNQALGDFAAMGDRRALGVAVPFWRWTRFVATLMGHTLPFDYPGRALLLYRISALGQQGQHQIGNLTPSLQGLIPLGQNSALTTQSVNPFATLGQDVLPNQGQSALDPSHAVGNLSPFGLIAYEMIAGRDPETGRQLKNAQGQPITSGPDRLRLLGSQAANLVPLTRAVAPLYGGGGLAPDTSINIPGFVQHGKQTAGAKQPDQPGWAGLLNQVLPVKYRAVDLALMAKQGAKKRHSQLIASYRADRKAAIEKIAARIGAERGLDPSDRTNPAVTQVLLDAIAEYDKGKK